ncbi:unnamed protein product [Adineta ricciae]|uniref:Sorting nexin-27 n=1 Tax=Adineta ricciae TaxID=249248 RepID=A0A813Q0Z0_ADIRI|nr:unnamed protein product [Adineta ricciae]
MSTQENTQVSKSAPRKICIKKLQDGFGFNVRGQVVEGGQIKSIHGKLYAPLQHVSAVSGQSAAEQAGLCIGDKILQVNGVEVEGASHKQVVDLIQQSGDELHLIVIGSNGDERRMGSSLIELSNRNSNDYTDRRSLAITVPDYSELQLNGEKFHVFNIYLAGRHLCSRRYREFDSLHQLLKHEFPDFPFEPLPKKWLFKLSAQQLDARRRGLEQYLDKICSVRSVGDSDIVKEFLFSDAYGSDSTVIDLELKINLPDGTVSNVKIKRFFSADKVYEILVEKIGLSKQCIRYFYLFENMAYNFERKLHSNEFPHQIYIKNCCSANSSCLSLRKFVFAPVIENQLLKYPLARKYLYQQAADQLNSIENSTIDHRSTLKTFDEVEFIKYAQSLTDIYNTITFPPCPCSSRKNNGHVILSVNPTRLRLHACTDDGQLDSEQIANFDWSIIGRHYLVDKGFAFEYKRSTMKTIKLQTSFGQFMFDCFECILGELKEIGGSN